jgi:proline iminopeptidase
MGRIIIINSGILAFLAFLAGEELKKYHSPLVDFIWFVCLPFFMLVFLAALFLVRIRRISSHPVTRNIFRGMRMAAVLGIGGLCFVVFWPRSYGALPRVKRVGIRYWDLPTGSHLAYTLIPAKGTPKPTPIIYLQGGPGGTVDYGLVQIMTPIAEEGYNVYLYDQIGSGWSDRLADIRDYTAMRHKRDLEAIVRAIGADKVILIGQSWGAILATLYAADNPDRVAGLILTGPGSIQPGRPELAGIQPPDSLRLRQPYYSNQQGNELANNIRTRAMAMFATKFGWKLASDEEADDFAGYESRLVNRSMVCDTTGISEARPRVPNGSGEAGFYVQVMTVRSFKSLPDPRPKLRNSSIPMLLMKGECDNQPWGYATEYLQLFPNHRLVIIPGAGHGIFFEQPQLYLSTIGDFLKNAKLHS